MHCEAIKVNENSFETYNSQHFENLLNLEILAH